MCFVGVLQETKLPDEAVAKLLECLNEAIYFDEVAISFTHMQSDCRDFMAGLKQNGVDLDSVISPGFVSLVNLLCVDYLQTAPIHIRIARFCEYFILSPRRL